MHAAILKYFVEVARCGSIRKASENLFVAASAVNRQILKLEEELGTELFDRMPGGLTLNAAGERLLKHVRSTLLDFQVVRGELDALKGERTGHVKISTVDSMFVDFLPAAVQEFSEQYPAVTYTIMSASPMDVPHNVFVGQADAGLTFIARLPAGLEVAADAALPLGVLMPPGHPLSEGGAVSLERCAPYPFLRSSGQSPISSSLCPEFAHFWESLEPAMTCNSTEMIKRMIMAGKGISFLSKIAFLDELVRGDLIWQPFELAALNQLRMGILVASQRRLPHVMEVFLDRLTRRLKQMELAAAAV